MTMKWEYLTLNMSAGKDGSITIKQDKSTTPLTNYITFTENEDINSVLNKFGYCSWELVSLEGNYYTFKRPISEV